jgi:hypothetical protein
VCLYFSRPSTVKLFVIPLVSVALFQYIRKIVPWIALFYAWVHSFLYLRIFLSNGPISCFKLFICVRLSILSTPTRASSDNTKRSSTSVTFSYLDTYILTLRSREEFNVGCICGHYWIVQFVVCLMRCDEELNTILGLQSFLCSTSVNENIKTCGQMDD